MTTADRPDVVAGLAARAGKILLIHNLRHGTATPGGKLRSGESHADGLRREFPEEVGLDVTAVGDLLLTDEQPAFRLFLYAVDVSEGEPVAGDDAVRAWFGDADELRTAANPRDYPYARALLDGELPGLVLYERARRTMVRPWGRPDLWRDWHDLGRPIRAAWCGAALGVDYGQGASASLAEVSQTGVGPVQPDAASAFLLGETVMCCDGPNPDCTACGGSGRCRHADLPTPGDLARTVLAQHRHVVAKRLEEAGSKRVPIRSMAFVIDDPMASAARAWERAHDIRHAAANPFLPSGVVREYAYQFVIRGGAQAVTLRCSQCGDGLQLDPQEATP